MNVADIQVFHSNSPAATDISHLFILVLVGCGAIFLMLTGVVVISLVRFRQSSKTGSHGQFLGNENWKSPTKQ